MPHERIGSPWEPWQVAAPGHSTSPVQYTRQTRAWAPFWSPEHSAPGWPLSPPPTSKAAQSSSFEQDGQQIEPPAPKRTDGSVPQMRPGSHAGPSALQRSHGAPVRGSGSHVATESLGSDGVAHQASFAHSLLSKHGHPASLGPDAGHSSSSEQDASNTATSTGESLSMTPRVARSARSYARRNRSPRQRAGGRCTTLRSHATGRRLCDGVRAHRADISGS